MKEELEDTLREAAVEAGVAGSDIDIGYLFGLCTGLAALKIADSGGNALDFMCDCAFAISDICTPEQITQIAGSFVSARSWLEVNHDDLN